MITDFIRVAQPAASAITADWLVRAVAAMPPSPGRWRADRKGKIRRTDGVCPICAMVNSRIHASWVCDAHGALRQLLNRPLTEDEVNETCAFVIAVDEDEPQRIVGGKTIVQLRHRIMRALGMI